MIKTITLTANQEAEIELTGGCHVSVENRGTGIIYASKSAGVTAGADGVIAIDSGNAKVLRNVAQYRNNDNSYDYYGKIYLLSASDTKAEIQTANDLNFFSRKNIAKGGDIDAYTKAETDNLLADKADTSDLTDYVKNTDYATSKTGGTVKIDSSYGIEIGSGTSAGILKTVPAYDNFLNSFTDDYHVITPYRFKKAMDLYGVTSQTQITEIQSDISILKNNSVNLIPYPYTNQNYVNGEWTEAVEVGGVTFTPAADGIILNGTNTSGERIIFSFAENFKLKAGETYTLSDSSEREFKSNIRIRYTDYNNMNSNLFGISTSKKVTYTAANDYNGMVYFSIDNGVSFDNVVFKPVLEIGNTAHAFKEYKDDLNSLIRSIIKRIDTLEG